MRIIQHIVGQGRMILTVAVFFAATLNAAGQRKADITYVTVDRPLTGNPLTPAPAKRTELISPFYDQTDPEWQLANSLHASVLSQEAREEIKAQQREAVAKREIVKSHYSAHASYPGSIADGWHNAVATDNMFFCRDVKVLVKDNRIQKFVVDNYMPVNFTAAGKIQDGKGLLSLKDFNDREIGIFELYFIYDLDEPTIENPPVEPGYVTFWSDMKKFEHIQLTLDGDRTEPFTVSFASMPEPFANGTISRVLKPGTYSFKAAGRGTIDWAGTVEVRPNQCAMIRLGR